MLKKLRLKFVLVNMTVVTIMLCVIFGLLYYSTGSNLERESLRMMESVAMNPVQRRPPNKPRGSVHLPYFSILIDRNGRAIEADGNFFDLSDKEQLNSILALTYEIKSESGVLKEYRLRFLRTETPMGQCIVFADMTSEQSTLRNLIRTFLMIGSAAFLVFLGISMLLARWAVKPVDRAWQQQKQFVADASHELKTPLTVIQTSAELLHAPDCPEADREPLSGSILTMSSQMRGLVENLLELARIDAETAKADFDTLLFSDLASDAAMMYEPVFFEKELAFRSEITPGIAVRGNAAHLMQLVNTLLDNAQKYAAPHGQTVIRLTRSTRNRCLLEVSDQGEPIPAEDQKNIFKRFYRSDKARAMNHSYGLGLSVAQSIVEEHKGKIWCESEEGWNRFFVELPCRENI